MNEKDTGDLSEQIVILGARIYPLFRQVFKDCHPDEIAVLHILRIKGGELERKELIKNLDIDPRIISKRVRDLLGRGLVDTYRSSSSARESIDRITEKGNQEFEDIRNRIKLLLKQGFGFIGKEEQKILGNIVNRANDKIDIITSIVKQVTRL